MFKSMVADSSSESMDTTIGWAPDWFKRGVQVIFFVAASKVAPSGKFSTLKTKSLRDVSLWQVKVAFMGWPSRPRKSVSNPGLHLGWTTIGSGDDVSESGGSDVSFDSELHANTSTEKTTLEKRVLGILIIVSSSLVVAEENLKLIRVWLSDQ